MKYPFPLFFACLVLLSFATANPGEMNSDEYTNCIFERDIYANNYSICTQEVLNLNESLNESMYYKGVYLNQNFNITYQDYIDLNQNYIDINTKINNISIALYINLALLGFTFISILIGLFRKK